jgi:hypothetical protein
MGSDHRVAQTRIVFVPLELSLSPMVRLAGGVEFPDPMTIDGLHNADLGEDHRPVILRGVADAVRGGKAFREVERLIAPDQLSAVEGQSGRASAQHLRLFNLQIDGVTVRPNINSGSTGILTVAPGTHTVGETGGTSTPLSAFETVIGGSCAANGTVTLALGDTKACTITNFDHFGGCTAKTPICCEPGDGQNGCQNKSCIAVGQHCP